MTEFKFQITIIPEDYDYGEQEIAYRIYLDEQLISERSLPILRPNQAIVYTFYLDIKDYKNLKFSFKNLKYKKATCEKIIVNDIVLNKSLKNIKLNGLALTIENL
jgi:hypothetical protein